MIVAWDANGREIIARNDWRNNVFLPGLAQKWNNAAELYDAILSGLNDGFAADLIPAAARLVEIDDDPERSHTIQGIVLMENKRLVEAESTLQAGIAKVGATGTLLTNLAKVFSHKGDDARAEELLWQAIEADPNLDNGLLWWASIKQEREGEAGYVAGCGPLRRCPDPGVRNSGWRAITSNITTLRLPEHCMTKYWRGEIRRQFADDDLRRSGQKRRDCAAC
jgi:tetratricopeptide (TPR) repeat protein